MIELLVGLAVVTALLFFLLPIVIFNTMSHDQTNLLVSKQRKWRKD